MIANVPDADEVAQDPICGHFWGIGRAIGCCEVITLQRAINRLTSPENVTDYLSLKSGLPNTDGMRS